MKKFTAPELSIVNFSSFAYGDPTDQTPDFSGEGD